MVKEGGIGTDLSQLPVAGSAPEAMSTKATSIALYVAASGITVHFYPPFQVHGSKKVLDYLTGDIEKDFGAYFIFEGDPKKAAQKIIAHLDKKREALKLKPMMYPPLNGETEKKAAEKQAVAAKS
jgi:carbon-monoxide dehydrogenase catalytic subunit